MAIKFLNTVQVDTDVLYVDTANDRVGIGTDTPLYKLQVQDRIHIEDTTSQQPKISFSENTNTSGEFVLEYNGVGGGAGNYVSFYSEVSGWTTKGNGLNYIPQNGRVGIGVVNPAVPLHVDGFVRVNGGLQMNATNTTIYQIQNSSLRFGTNNTERMRIDSVGKVGIGTTSPNANLEIKDNNPRIRLTSSSTGISDEDTVGAIDFYTSDASSLGQAVNAKIEAFADDIYGRMGLRFYTGGAGAPTEKMRIAHGGNVGIGTGTGNPAEKLDVAGNIKLTDNVKVSANKGFVNSGAWTRNATPYGNIEFGPANTTWAHIYTDRPNFYFNKELYVNNQRVYNTGYHPEADKWTTARTLTLTGYATGSVSWDGSGNVSMTTAVAKIKAGGNGPSTENLNSVADSVSVGQLEYRGFNSSSTNAPAVSDNANGVITVGQHSGNYNAQLAFSSNGNMYWRDNPSTTYGSWRKMWDSGNDGSGSGLDADLLDGQQGSYYLDYANFTGTPTIPSVGNGQIDGRTSGLGLSGSMDATANQSGNTTFTVTSNATSDATASTIAYRNGSADIRARLFRSNYQNQSTISGGMAYRVNNGNDDYIRFCTDKAAIRTFLGVPASGDLGNYLPVANPTFTGTLSGPIFSGNVTASGDGQSNYPFRLGADYNSYMMATANNTWGLFWAGNSGARYGTNGIGGPGNIWGNSGNPNEFAFVGSDSTAWTVYGTNGNVWQKGDLWVNGGDITLGGTGRIQGVDTVSASTDATNKAYVDSEIATRTPLNDIRSLGVEAFTNGANPNITTAQVMDEIDSDGGFDSYSSVFKTSWSYAGNYNLTDAGRFTETAGSSWITWTDNSSDSTRGNVTTLAIAPNTGGSAGKVFIYNNQGGSYAPGWREVWTSTSDGAGSGLDADLLDGQQGSYYAPASSLGSYLLNTTDTFTGTLTVTKSSGDVLKVEAGSQDITTNFVLPTTSSGLNNIISTGGKFNLGTSDAKELKLTTNSLGRLTILSGGNVGIGLPTPNAKLNVNGGIKIEGSSSLSFGGTASVPAWAINNSGNNLVIDDQATTSGDVLFTNNGDVGVGTTTPGAKFHVEDPTVYMAQNPDVFKISQRSPEITIQDTAGSSGYVAIDTKYQNSGGYSVVKHTVQSNPGGVFNRWIFDTGGPGGTIMEQKQNSFHWSVQNSQKLTLNSLGYLGINDTTPGYSLDVNGSGRFTGTVTATNFVLSSDERLKENIEKVCDNIIKVDWKTFELKADKGQKRYGVIAQELEKTNPEFVREDVDGFKSVAYVDLLIAKIAELEARLEKLEK